MSGGGIFLAIGSNMGDKIANCKMALRLIEERQIATIVKKSNFYETPPMGQKDQETFINCAVELSTMMEPEELLSVLKAIEAEMGRTHTGKWGPRPIDLDIIFYGHKTYKSETLVIPHPHAHERSFVLIPLCDIAADFEHPTLKVKVCELAEGFRGDESVKKVG